MANYFIDGRQVDLTVLKRDAVIVIELKEHADPIRSTENSNWITTLDGKAVGTEGQNLFEQAKSYRSSWVDFCVIIKIDFSHPARLAACRRKTSEVSKDTSARKVTSAGWRILRFDTHQIREQMASYCISEVQDTIEELKGVADDGLVSRRFYVLPDGAAQQLTLFEAEAEYDLD